MNDREFPKPVSEVVEGLARLFEHQSNHKLAALLRNCDAYLELTDVDNWNGGTYTWSLRLQAPLEVFAPIEPQLETNEKLLAEKLRYFDREYPNYYLGEVTISPITDLTTNFGQRLAPSQSETERLWGSSPCFRLFLSHVSTHKKAVAALRKALQLRGVRAFVAHNDIEPTREWQDEIELALRSMHALVAVITPDFHQSKWTDHEVGWALGRGLLVLPIRAGHDPYGLIGKFQALHGRLNQPNRLAASIASALLTSRHSRGDMRRAAIESFAKASSEQMAQALAPLITQPPELTPSELEQVHRACSHNRFVRECDAVVSTIYDTHGRPRAAIEDEIPF